MRRKIVACFLCLVAIFTLEVACDRVTDNTAHGNCCLCMCHAKDETRCSQLCLRLQHSRRIIDLPHMDLCTKECDRVRVDKLSPDADVIKYTD